MKILITTDWYKPAVNGVVTSVSNLADTLTALGHELRILTLANETRTRLEGNVIYIGSANAGYIYPNARFRVAAARRITGELIDWQPDIIHSQCEFSTFSLARKIARACDVPLVHTYHTVYEDYTNYFSPHVRLGKKMAEQFSKRIIAETDAVIAPSEKILRLLNRYKVEKPVYVLPSGLVFDRFSFSAAEKAERRAAVRRALGIGADEPLFIYVGRLAREKNIAELFDLLQIEASPRWRMLLVGDGPYRGELEAYAEKVGIKARVIFAGMVSPDSVADYYAAGDVFVSASQSETQGLTYIEAMASSLPSLCKYDPCLDGVIDNCINGFTYRSPDEFHEYSDRLLASEAARRQAGEAAAASAREKYSVKRFADSACDIYRESIEAYSRRENSKRNAVGAI